MATGATTESRAVVITGASTGIGEACALRLDKQGWQVFAGVRKEADGERLTQQASGRLTPIILDVTDEAQIRAAAGSVRATVADAGLAGLINNAGIGIGGPLEFLPLDDLRLQLEVNLIGQVAVTQAFLPLIRKGQGRIVNIGSIGGRMATPFVGPYNASKFGMEAITDALRQELRPWGIHVSIVEPGSITTAIWDKTRSMADDMQGKLSQEARDLYDPFIAPIRAATEKIEQAGIPPDEVAKFVEHALTARNPKTRYVVGRDAQIQRILAKFAPDRIRDRLVAWQLGLPRET